MGRLIKSNIDKYYKKPQIKALELSDGDNLYLMVTKIGSCKFKYRIRNENQASWIALGDYPAMTLDEARRESLKIKSMIQQGIDPIVARQREKSKAITFADFAKIYIDERLPRVRTKERGIKVFMQLLDTQIIAIIGNYSLTSIDDSAVRKVLHPKLSDNKYGIAKQLRVMIKVIMDYAVEKELIAKNPVGSVKSYNITGNSFRKRFLSDKEITNMMQVIYPTKIMKTKYKIAIHLLLMLLLRKTELIHAKWEQIDFDKATFNIETSKMGSQLVIPLPHQAISLFRIMQDLSTGSPYIFTGKDGYSAMNEHTMNKQNIAINHLVFADDKDKYFTIHDLRRTGATHLGELGYPSDYIEVALNHTKGGIKQVYQRSQYIEQRKEMLQRWADKLDELIGSSELLPYGKKFVI